MKLEHIRQCWKYLFQHHRNCSGKKVSTVRGYLVLDKYPGKGNEMTGSIGHDTSEFGILPPDNVGPLPIQGDRNLTQVLPNILGNRRQQHSSQLLLRNPCEYLRRALDLCQKNLMLTETIQYGLDCSDA